MGEHKHRNSGDALPRKAAGACNSIANGEATGMPSVSRVPLCLPLRTSYGSGCDRNRQVLQGKCRDAYSSSTQKLHCLHAPMALCTPTSANAKATHRSFGFEAGFGHHVHLALLDQVVELVTSVSECRDLDLSTSRVYQVKAEHLALPPSVVICPHSALDRHSSLDRPAVLVGIQAVDRHNLGRSFIAGNGRIASPVIWCWLPISTPPPLWSPVLIATPACPIGTAC